MAWLIKRPTRFSAKSIDFDVRLCKRDLRRALRVDGEESHIPGSAAASIDHLARCIVGHDVQLAVGLACQFTSEGDTYATQLTVG